MSYQYPHNARFFRPSGVISDGRGGFTEGTQSLVWSGSCDIQDVQDTMVDDNGNIVKIGDGKVFLSTNLYKAGIKEGDLGYFDFNNGSTYFTGSVVKTRELDDKLSIRLDK